MRMQNIDKFKFAIGVLWICMGIIGLFGRRISLLRRAIFLLMSVFYAAVGFAGAFNTDLSTMTGISSSTVFIIHDAFAFDYYFIGYLGRIF